DLGDRANAADHVLSHHRCGLRVDHHRGIVTDNDPGVGVALGGVRVSVIGELVKADLLLLQVGLRGEFFFTHGCDAASGACGIDWKFYARRREPRKKPRPEGRGFGTDETSQPPFFLISAFASSSSTGPLPPFSDTSLNHSVAT